MGADVKIVDVHAEIHSEHEYPGGTGFEAQGLLGAMDQDGVPVALLSDACHSFGNVGADWRAGNDHAAEAVLESSGRLLGIGVINPVPDPEAAVEEVERVSSELGFVGIKLVPSAFHHVGNDPAIVGPVVDAAARRDLPVVIQTNEGPFATPVMVQELARHHPDATLILSHRGYITMFHAFSVVQHAPNLCLDISPLMEWEAQWAAQLFMTEGFPRDRILYGSNFPHTRPRTLLRALKQSELSPEALDQIVSGNAKRIFGIA